jgi:hypothetical protein
LGVDLSAYAERSIGSKEGWVSALLLLWTSFGIPESALADGSSHSDPYPDEVSWFGERVYSLKQWPPDSGWGISYFKVFTPYLGASLAYLNDAHFPGHHRDGVSAEAWVPILPFRNRLTLSVGLGSFYYYDTVFAQNTAGYADAHGWAWISSLRSTWQPFDSYPHFFLEGRIDYTAPAKSIETSSFGLGIGYRGISDAHGGSDLGIGFEDDEVVASYWKTVTNSFNSGSHEARAGAIDYRRKVWKEIRWSVGFLKEGDTQLIRRSGVTTEAWAEPSFGSGRWSIGAGFGFYSAIDKYRPAPGRHLSDVVSVTLSFCPVEHMDIRFLWHRIVTDYDRDTDIVLWGLGYRF